MLAELPPEIGRGLCWKAFHMLMNLMLTKPSGFKLALITIASCSQSDGVIKIKANRMTGGGLWVGTSMHLSVKEVDCNTATAAVAPSPRHRRTAGSRQSAAPLGKIRFMHNKPD